jgi:F-box protein 21
MEGRLILLPDEILHLILCHVHPRECVALERTARRFRDITNEPLLWRLYCQRLFHFWDERHEFQKKLAGPIDAVDWKRLYVTRHLIDEATSDTLDSVLSSQSGRIEKFHTIISFGYDVKDTLIRHSLAGPDQEDHLARRLAFCSPSPLPKDSFDHSFGAGTTAMLSLAASIGVWLYLSGLS